MQMRDKAHDISVTSIDNALLSRDPEHLKADRRVGLGTRKMDPLGFA